MNQQELYAFLTQSKLAVLASACDGKPQAALVGVAFTEKLEIIFDTVRSSRKYGNLLSNCDCSLVIGWTGEQTVQYEGKAEELHTPELDQYLAVYFEAWPDAREHRNWPDLVYFLVRPTWVRFSDYDQRPPAIHEFKF